MKQTKEQKNLKLRMYRAEHRAHVSALRKAERSSESSRTKRREYRRLWRARNPEKTKAEIDRWRKRHPDKYNALRKRMRQKLTDSYVTSIITTRSVLKAHNIPAALIEATRANIQLKRLTRKTYEPS